MRVLICDDMFPAMIETVTRLLPQDEVRICLQQDAVHSAPWAEVLIPAMTRITADMIQSAPDLKLIQQFGVGLEGVQMGAATERGIPVSNVPGNQAPIHAECTAEGGVFLMMACARRFKAAQQTLKRGEWGRPCGMALIDRTALIIGLGAVGRALAVRLAPLGMRVLATDLNPQPAVAERLGLSRFEGPESLNQMLPEADFVISTVTLTPETRGLLNLSVFERMKSIGFVINISRGPIVNEDDLLTALNSGCIAGAGLDVLTQEPPRPDHPLLADERVVVTPHTAGVTDQSFTALGRAVADNIARLKRGEPLQNVANL
ncbi:MAG: Hydroxyacid dehydrogenase [Thermodesulfobacteriota bacterium]|nr:Hydroxyacid dehydrogenase [Thermodesulfobacteriota bacterium]